MDREETEEEFRARLRAEIEEVHFREVPPPIGRGLPWLRPIISEEELDARVAAEPGDTIPTDHPDFRIIHNSAYTRQQEARRRAQKGNEDTEKFIQGIFRIRDDILEWPDSFRQEVIKAGRSYSQAKRRGLLGRVLDGINAIKQRFRSGK